MVQRLSSRLCPAAVSLLQTTLLYTPAVAVGLRYMAIAPKNFTIHAMLCQSKNRGSYGDVSLCCKSVNAFETVQYA